MMSAIARYFLRWRRGIFGTVDGERNAHSGLTPQNRFQIYARLYAETVSEWDGLSIPGRLMRICRP